MDFPDEHANRYECNGKIWLFPTSKAPWYFFTIDGENADRIYFENSLNTFGNKRGFKSVKVSAIIGDTTFTTSIFLNSKEKTYFLPIKASVRKAENITAGDEITVLISLI